MNKHRTILLSSFAFFSVVSFCYADQRDAEVTTDAISYTVPVEVDNGKVTYVYWPNGRIWSLTGADISDGEASGMDFLGRAVHVRLDNYEGEESNNYEGEEKVEE